MQRQFCGCRLQRLQGIVYYGGCLYLTVGDARTTTNRTIDLIGVPDAMNGFWRIIWGLETNPWPGVCPMDHAGEKPLKKTWRFTNAVPSWTWHGHGWQK